MIKDFRNLAPGIFFVLGLFVITTFTTNIARFAPKYYAGDPNFNIEQYTNDYTDSLKSSGQYFVGIEQHIIYPTIRPSNTVFFIANMSGKFTFIWIFGWSTYAYVKRKDFPSKYIIWSVSFLLLASIVVFTISLRQSGINWN